jgi:hypothetical protein
MVQKSVLTVYANVEHDFPHQWHARVNFYWGEDWDRLRVRNINAPMVASSIGTAPDPLAALRAPRPFAQNENILQYQNEGHLAGNLVSMSLDQHSYKRFDLHFSYRHVIFKSDGGDALGSPQSSYSDQGESSRADWMRANAGSFFGNVYLPFKIQWSAQLDGSTGAAYNITTGTDSNGDGIFNDRPAHASTPGTGTYLTRYGLLTTNTVNGNLPRNAGTLPSHFHLDTNLSREFVLNPKDTDHLRTFTVNMRSANVLNHTNVTGVSAVLSPTLGQPTLAEPESDVELSVNLPTAKHCWHCHRVICPPCFLPVKLASSVADNGCPMLHTSAWISSLSASLLTSREIPCLPHVPIQYSAFSPLAGTEVGTPGMPA